MTTPRENLLRTLRRQGFETVPLDTFGFCESQIQAFKARFGHANIQDYFSVPFRGCSVPHERTWTDAAKLYPREILPSEATIDVMGVAHSQQPNCYHMTRMHHPLKGDDVTLDEIRAYPLPKPAPDALNRTRQAIEEIHSRGLAARASMACTVWESAWYIRSMEDLMADMMVGDERAVLHLDRVTERAVDCIQIAARGGADIIQLGDDIGMQHTIMMSVALWREWLKPRLARIIAAGRAINPDLLMFYHSCGYVIPFLEELIEIGVDILNPVQPECMRFDDVHERVGHRISFWGTIGTQTTLPFGTPDEVREVVWQNLRVCGSKGGIVIGPTHLVEPEVPWANLVAMKEACESFRL